MLTGSTTSRPSASMSNAMSNVPAPSARIMEYCGTSRAVGYDGGAPVSAQPSSTTLTVGREATCSKGSSHAATETAARQSALSARIRRVVTVLKANGAQGVDSSEICLT